MKRLISVSLGLALAWCPLFADGVTRALEPVAGGCQVTLSWEFAGNVESDLIIEERFARGWSVDDATVPFDSLDASWFSGTVARFAVKPSLLAQPGSIRFTLLCGEGAAAGSVAGDWKMYLGGTLRKGAVVGARELVALDGSGTAGSSGNSGVSGNAGVSAVAATPVAIKSFRVVGAGVELAYSGVATGGTLVVEGCAGLDKPWMEIKRLAVAAGDGMVTLSVDDVGASRFFRMQLLTEAE